MVTSILNIQEKQQEIKFRSLQTSAKFIRCTKMTSAMCSDEI